MGGELGKSGYNHNAVLHTGGGKLLISRPVHGIFLDLIPQRRPVQSRLPVRADEGPEVKGAGLGPRKRIGLIAYAVIILIFAAIIIVIVANSGIPDIKAGILIGIDIVSIEVVAEDEVIPVLIEPYAMFIVRGVVVVDGIELAAL